MSVSSVRERIPILPCRSIDVQLAFYQALGIDRASLVDELARADDLRVALR